MFLPSGVLVSYFARVPQPSLLALAPNGQVTGVRVWRIFLIGAENVLAQPFFLKPQQITETMCIPAMNQSRSSRTCRTKCVPIVGRFAQDS